MKNFMSGLIISLILIFIWNKYSTNFEFEESRKHSQSNSKNSDSIKSATTNSSVVKNELKKKTQNTSATKDISRNINSNIRKSTQNLPSKIQFQDKFDPGQTTAELRKILLTMVENADEAKLETALSVVEAFAKPDSLSSFNAESENHSDTLSTQNREAELETSFLQLSPFNGLAVLSSVKCKETICKVVFKLPPGTRFTPFSLYNWDKTLITVSIRHMDDNSTIISAYFPLDKSNPEDYKQMFASIVLP